ncbi:sugar ABC transporter permease [Aeromicrobium ponti]|uniref:Raffinose/stachyose/melibiose transport system permease protein n=1 Tax=Cytobacillus oceanisediminis TaxID=665099 RepID=A0A562J4E4_9BACI|nr:sugar ABC transporter permease [Cytobacillus oceanisediminis]TWH78032.1 raffinose/stachyose/melibiose transport system permease protein [Cytobacillus oceanisediminis]
MKSNRLWYTLFLAPAILIFLLVFGFPVVNVIFTSFFDYKINQPMKFIGFDNYIALFSDKAFLISAKNTIIWVVLQGTVHVILGVAVALVLSHKPFGWKIVRTSYMIPIIISSAARAMLLLYVFNPQMGLVNSLFKMLGFENFSLNWYYDPSTSFWTVTSGWLFFASLITIIVMAEIATIPQSLYDAAKIDGASKLQTDLFVVLPLLRNVIGISVILAATSMLKEFELIFLTTNGGPNDTNLNLPLYLYKEAMMLNNYGYANSIGTLLIFLGLILIFTITKLFRFGQSDV